MWSLTLGTESKRPHERTQLEGDCRCTVVVAWPRHPKGGNLRGIQARFRRVGGDALSPLPSCAISHPESFVNALAAAGRISTANQQVRVALASPAQLTRCTRDAWRLTDDELFGLGTTPVPPRNVSIGLFVVDSLRRPGNALRRMAELAPLLSGFPQIRLERRCDTTTTTVCVELRPEIRGHETRVDNPIDHLLTAFVLIFRHRFSAWLIGHRLKPVTVQLPFPESDQLVRTTTTTRSSVLASASMPPRS